MDDNVLSIPRWFTWLVSGLAVLFMGTFVPWATWVTWTLITISVKLDTVGKTELKVDAAYTQVQEHTIELRDLLRRLENLEKKGHPN